MLEEVGLTAAAVPTVWALAPAMAQLNEKAAATARSAQVRIELSVRQPKLTLRNSRIQAKRTDCNVGEFSGGNRTLCLRIKPDK
jgi:hypothetical protein